MLLRELRLSRIFDISLLQGHERRVVTFVARRERNLGDARSRSIETARHRSGGCIALSAAGMIVVR